MKPSFRIFLVILMLLFGSGCQSKPKSKPLTEMSEAELVEMYKYGAVDKPVEKNHFSWGGFFKGVGAVILYIPVAIFSHPPVDRGS